MAATTHIWIRWLAGAGVLLCLVVVVLGAYVRLTDAGLGCPDWPGCYGHVTPLGAAADVAAAQARFPGSDFDTGKAWREMIHRYAAGVLGLIVVGIAALALATRGSRAPSIIFTLVLLATIVLQAVLGMLTVTWLLKPLIVTLHLVGGLATLSLLFWLWLSMRRAGRIVRTPVVSSLTTPIALNRPGIAAAPLRRARRGAFIGLAALGLQIALGGWTSSNYAAVSCLDVPRCQNQWWPDGMNFADAFVLWRGLDINYTGGVLEHPARVAIHVTHRLGALIAAFALLLAAALALRTRVGAIRSAAVYMLGALGLQVLIGVTMVARGFPLMLATAHNAGAALLLLATLNLLHRLKD